LLPMELPKDICVPRERVIRFIDLTGPKHRDSEVQALADLEVGMTHVHNHSNYQGRFVNWIAQQRRRLRKAFGYRRLGGARYEITYIGPKEECPASSRKGDAGSLDLLVACNG
jgi:hypothetical protein